MKTFSMAIFCIALLSPSLDFKYPTEAKETPTVNEPLTLTFKNISWDYITVEIYNRGNRSNCDGCPVVETFSLRRNEQYTIDVYHDICYRSKTPGMLWSVYYGQDYYSWGGERTIMVTSGGIYPKK